MNPPLLNNRRIFVVEDNVTNMAVISVLLRQHGALVIQDPWNSRTLDMLAQFMPIDVILLDLMLRSGVSGYDIFTEIKRVPEFAHIPIVAVSASDPSIEIPRAQSLGFTGFIGKPIELHRFPSQVLSCINNEPIWAAQ